MNSQLIAYRKVREWKMSAFYTHQHVFVYARDSQCALFYKGNIYRMNVIISLVVQSSGFKDCVENTVRT
jgi:hypothetical protein